MFALHIFFLLVAASLASSTEAMGYSEGSKAMTASSLAQFSFAPFELTDVCVACSRRNESASYKCNLKCKKTCELLSLSRRLTSDDQKQSESSIQTRFER